MQKITIPENISFFLNDLLDSTGIASDDILREGMLEELYIRLEKFLYVKILEYIPADKLADFVDLQKGTKNQEEKVDFFMKNIPHASDLFLLFLAEFKQRYEHHLDNARKEVV